MADTMRVRTGGSGQPLLLLLHGLGATGDVWQSWLPLLERHWPGRWLAPDLPGHGGSAPLHNYSFQSLAARVADQLDPADRIIVLGHSLGGVLGLVLAGADHPLPVEAVVGLGVKVAWSQDELAKAAALAQRPVTWFGSRDEAAVRHLRVSGLSGLIPPDAPAVDGGLREQGGQWRLALDPPAFGVGAPDLPGLLAAARAPVLLVRGEHDPMVTDAQLAALGAPTRTLPGLGHNAHVEDPATVFGLIEAYR